VECLLDRHLDLGGLVSARYWSPASPAAAGEQPAEELLEVDVLAAGVAEAARRRASAPGPGPSPSSSSCAAPLLRVDILRNLPEIRAERVVAPPGARVGQHRVGLRDVFEAILSPWILIDIRVVRPRELSVGTLDLILTGVPRHAQDLVKVLVGHNSDLATMTWAGRSWLSPSP
jgi:hypothetical protein